MLSRRSVSEQALPVAEQHGGHLWCQLVDAMQTVMQSRSRSSPQGASRSSAGCKIQAVGPLLSSSMCPEQDPSVAVQCEQQPAQGASLEGMWTPKPHQKSSLVVTLAHCH